jgi:hypothetical protein
LQLHVGQDLITMKTPRHEQPWYEARLENNKKPSKITEEERTILTEENRRLMEEAASIISWGVANGWIAYPLKEQRKWKMEIKNPEGSSIDQILE